MMKNIKNLLSVASFLLFFVAFMGTADAARFYLAPASKEFNTDCEVAVNIMMDTEGSSASAGDALINFDPSEVTIVDQDSGSPGTQIREGSVFDVYPGNTVKLSEDRIYLTGFNLFSNFNGSGTYGVIILKGRPGVTSTTLSFEYTAGSTTDSNIANSVGTDILSGVSGGTYTFADLGFCGADTEPPVVSNRVPAPGSTGNALNSNIKFDISDEESGVDIDTVVVNVDTVDYQNGDTGFSFSGDSSKYSITINPPTDFLPDTPVFVEINADDISGNVMVPVEYSFNQPLSDNDPPYVSGADPAPNDQGVALDSNIVMHVRDDLGGVDINTVEVTVDGVLYSRGDANFNFSGGPADYFIVVDPVDDFSPDTPVEVVVDASDLRGNVMLSYEYSFNHPDDDSIPPYVESVDPSPDSTGVPVSTNISFHLKDNLSGVSLDSVLVKVDGRAYDRTSFNYSGGPLDYAIQVDPASDLPSNREIFVEIDARDLRGNVMGRYSFSFNRQSVCGDKIVEGAEECEPPGTGACSLACTILLCEELVAPVVPAEEGVTPLAGMLRLSDEERAAVEESTRDSDGDGLSDVVEERYGTSSDNDDSDGDGISDLEEILEYDTDPNVADVEVMRTKIVNWKDGDVTGSGRLFVKGVGHTDKETRVFATSTEGVRFFLGEDLADDENKFAFLSDVQLEEGDYVLVAESYEDNGSLIDESTPIKITIDFTKALPSPTVEAISDVPVLEGVQVVVTDRQPVVFGTTVPGSQVFAVFESHIVTSTIIADSNSGFFTIYAPRPLELGSHKVTVYAVTPDGITSEVKVVDFEITEKPSILKSGSFWFWFILILIILLVLGYLYYRWKKSEDEEKKKDKELLGESIVDKGVEKKKEGGSEGTPTPDK